MHALVYGAAFRGQPLDHVHAPWWSVFARYTVVGYAIAILLCAFLLWTFGRLDGMPVPVAMAAVVVLASIHGDEAETTVVVSEALRCIPRGDLQAAVILCGNPDGMLRGYIDYVRSQSG